MIKIIGKLKNTLGIESARSENIARHVLRSFLFKGGSVLANFLLVPLTISYLNNEYYGIWLTLSSILVWFMYLDIGIGHGLRNKLAEAIANNDKELARSLVSTAYIIVGTISLIFLVISILASQFLEWTVIFNTSFEDETKLRILMLIVFSSFSFQLVGKLITTIYLANQKHSIQDQLGFATATVSLLLVWILLKVSSGSLLLFGTIFSLLPVLILGVLSIIGFGYTYKRT